MMVDGRTQAILTAGITWMTIPEANPQDPENLMVDHHFSMNMTMLVVNMANTHGELLYIIVYYCF